MITDISEICNGTIDENCTQYGNIILSKTYTIWEHDTKQNVHNISIKRKKTE